jgi:hypothetical protein
MTLDLARIVIYAILLAVIYVVSPLRATDEPVRSIWTGTIVVAYVSLAVWLIAYIVVKHIESKQPRVAQAHKIKGGKK